MIVGGALGTLPYSEAVLGICATDIGAMWKATITPNIFERFSWRRCASNDRNFDYPTVGLQLEGLVRPPGQGEVALKQGTSEIAQVGGLLAPASPTCVLRTLLCSPVCTLTQTSSQSRRSSPYSEQE